MLHFLASYLKSPWSLLNSPSLTLPPPSSVKRTQIVLKMEWFPTKFPQALLPPLPAFSKTVLQVRKYLNKQDIDNRPRPHSLRRRFSSLSAFVYHDELKPRLRVWPKNFLPLALFQDIIRGEEKSLSGKKFESPKKSHFFLLFVLVQVDLELLQMWHTIYFEIYSQWWRME